MNRPFSKALVINLAGVGDVLLSTALARALKNSSPQSQVDFLVDSKALDVLQGNPNIRGLLSLNRGAWKNQAPWKAWAEQWSLARRIRAMGYDLVLDLTPTGRTLFLSRMAWGAYRVTFHRGWRTVFYDRAVMLNKRQYQGQIYLELHRALGGEEEDPRPQIFPDGGAQAEMDQLLAAQGPGPWAVLHVGGGWKGKWWPLAQYMALARLLMDRNWKVAVLWGPGEEEEARQFSRTVPKAWVVPFLNLRQVAALLSRAKVLVSGDSGPRHMMSALNLPSVGLFGPTWPQSWSLSGPGTEVLSASLGCGPCDKTDCPDPRCLQEVTPRRVFEAVERVVAQHAAKD